MSLHAFTSKARQYISKRRVNRESHNALLGRLIFLYHLEHQMVQIPSWLHSTFKDLSNEYSHAQIRVKTKKLWHRQVGEEKQVAVRKYVATRKVCRDRKYVATSVATKQAVATSFATSSMSRPVSRQAVCRDQCRNQKALSRPESLVATRNAQKPKKKAKKLIF